MQDTDEYTGMSSVEPKRQRRKTHGALGTGAVAESSVGLELSERRTGLDWAGSWPGEGAGGAEGEGGHVGMGDSARCVLTIPDDSVWPKTG